MCNTSCGLAVFHLFVFVQVVGIRVVCHPPSHSTIAFLYVLNSFHSLSLHYYVC